MCPLWKTLVLCGLLLHSAFASEWPRYLGSDGAAEWRGVKLPATLVPEKVEPMWSVAVGGGYAGVAVAGEQVFTMDRPEGASRERVLAFDRSSGERLWVYEYAAEYGDLDHPSGPRATPLIDGGRVYTLGAMGRLACLDRRTGKPIWTIDAVKGLKAEIPIWGYAASPILVEGLLIAHLGARPGGTIVALDPDTGEERWRALDDRPGYSTPIVENGTLVAWTADAAWGLDPPTGQVLWTFPFRTSSFDVAIISPVVERNRLYLSGFWDGAATALLSSNPPAPSWKSRVPANLMATPLWRDGYLYTLDRRQGLLCIQWETGEVLWTDNHQMTPQDRNPHAAMVWAGERAAFLNSEGELILATLSPEGYREEGRVKIIGPTWAHPAFAGQEVFARDDTRLAAVRVSPD